MDLMLLRPLLLLICMRLLLPLPGNALLRTLWRGMWSGMRVMQLLPLQG